jgi:hypothetical protein
LYQRTPGAALIDVVIKAMAIQINEMKTLERSTASKMEMSLKKKNCKQKNKIKRNQNKQIIPRQRLKLYTCTIISYWELPPSP